ncbi:hypothetical protein [Emticicia sp. W12TSBA100-4]|uniref:hypothetical protein n=1 Tax=Emticicia sp. W12TSBA100-4 TaxID=3160965 RepID=UPI0033063B35
MRKVFSTSILAILIVSGIATSCKESNLQPQSENQPVVNVSQPQNDLEVSAAATTNPNARAAANTEGWASVTAFRAASTSVQMNVVRLANAANGRMSGTSVTDTQGRWLTDCADGDGARMRSAIAKYDKWYRANVKTRCSTPVVPASVRTDMYNSFSGSAYDVTRRNALVNQTIARYNSFACNSSVAVPSTDNATLSFLNIQRQCLEWAETIGRSAGGSARGYYATGVSSVANYRPGMALYKTDRSHATLITDIYWNADGTIRKVKVAEANYGSGWINPNGMIPWQRTVAVGREITSLSGYKVVSFE